jgi:hypothetical protein
MSGNEDFSNNDSNVIYDGRWRIRLHISKIQGPLRKLEGSFIVPEIIFEISDLINDLVIPLDILLEKRMIGEPRSGERI